jgi:membrane-associated phospholipid phosphatase
MSILLLCLLLLTPATLRARESSETAADILRVLLPASACGLTFLHDDPEGRPQFYKSFLSTVGVTYLLKETVDAERPNGGGGSFPSGHASMVFSGAAFMQRRYGWSYGAPAYLLAAFVGWSRVDSDDHRVRDVVAGAAIGVAFAHLFTDRFAEGKLQVIPALEESGAMVTWKRLW